MLQSGRCVKPNSCLQVALGFNAGTAGQTMLSRCSLSAFAVSGLFLIEQYVAMKAPQERINGDEESKDPTRATKCLSAS